MSRVPTGVSLMSEVATPFVVVTRRDYTAPANGERDRRAVSTGLLYWSHTVAVSTLLWPTSASLEMRPRHRVGASAVAFTIAAARDWACVAGKCPLLR